MKQNQKQNAGVWLDNEQAIIITENAESEFAIGQKLKADHSRGGGSEHALNHAKQTEALKFFKSLATHLLPFEEILIFGPGQSQEQFKNHLDENAQFKNKQITIESAEHVSDPQMIAKVRNFFENRSLNRVLPV